ncbi:hypothetical protein M5Z68_10395, partial [Neisseria meningitidis]|nr:hypothetical protein [Neisseria meningitidis]MCL5758686.1 hypothetical protein [Neisseria meningitidis]
MERRTLSVWNKRANPLGFALFSFCLPFEKPESVCRLNIAATFQTALDSDFKCNTSVLVVGTDSRIKHLAFRSQVFFLVGGSTH